MTIDPAAAARGLVAAWRSPVPELMSRAELERLAREVVEDGAEDRSWDRETVRRLLGHIAAMDNQG